MVKKETEMTIEDLAQMVAKGFNNTATKGDLTEVKEDLAEVKENLTEVKQEVSKLSGKVDNLQNRLDVHAGLDRKVEKMDHRLTTVEKLVGVDK